MASATQVLGGVIASPSATRILQRAERDPRWPASVTALARLAGWLDQNGAPVDYQRRRGLDYGNLLPDSDWARSAVAPGQSPASATGRTPPAGGSSSASAARPRNSLPAATPPSRLFSATGSTSSPSSPPRTSPPPSTTTQPPGSHASA